MAAFAEFDELRVREVFQIQVQMPQCGKKVAAAVDWIAVKDLAMLKENFSEHASRGF